MAHTTIMPLVQRYARSSRNAGAGARAVAGQAGRRTYVKIDGSGATYTGR